jgi:hypothetical protein
MMIFLAAGSGAVTASSRLSRSRNCLLVLKNGWCFSLTGTLSPVSGIAPDAGGAPLDRERTEAAQLDPVPVRQRRGDLAEDRGNDNLCVAAVKVRVGLR